MKKNFFKSFSIFIFSFLFMFLFNNVAHAACPELAPYQCNNGSCVNEASLCNQSWGGGVSGGSTPAPSTLNGVTNPQQQMCTGDVNNDIAAAQACAELAQSQARSRGYTATCQVDVSASPFGGNSYAPTCTINGSTGHGATLLVGYVNPNGAPTINPGWSILGNELRNIELYGALQPCTPSATNSYFCPGGTATTKSTSSSGSSSRGSATTTSYAFRAQAASIEETINNVQKSILSISQSLYRTYLDRYGESSPQAKVIAEEFKLEAQQKSNSGQVLPFGNIANGNNSDTTPNNGTGVNTIPGSGSTCVTFTRNLTLNDSGADITALAKVLVTEGLFENTRATVFDTSMRLAVIAFQEKYSVQILAPLGLTSGTGIVGESTRNYLNSKCSNSATLPIPTTGDMSFRYMKVYTTEKGWVSWREIEIYDRTGIKISGITATASNTYGGDWQYPPISAQVASNVLDGNTNTPWNAGETNPDCLGTYGPTCPTSSRSASITLDLGSVKNVGMIRLVQNGNTSSEKTDILLSNDNITFNTLYSFTGAMADGEVLQYPVVANANIPAPMIAARLMSFPLSTPYSTERNNLYNVYPNLIKGTAKVQNGEETITVKANVGGQGDIVAYLWSIGNADSIKIDKQITNDPSLGTIPVAYQNSLACAGVSLHDLSMFPATLEAGNSTTLASLGLSTVTLFPNDFTMPNTRSITARPSECNIGKVYTTTITATNKGDKTAVFKLNIRVTQ